MKEGWTIPTVEQFKHSLQVGKEKGMYNWYQEFNEMITEYCIQQEEDVEFFLSLIATASPNSGINQNAINSLLNYRALRYVTMEIYFIKYIVKDVGLNGEVIPLGL
jgi:hypothetical protein